MITTKRFAQYWHIFWQLFKTDLLVFWPQLSEDIINIVVWLTSFLTVWAYALPALGMLKTFGTFAAFSLIASESYWRIWPTCFELINDLDGDKAIDYHLTLPLPSELIFVELILLYAFKSIIFSFVTFPLSVLILWNQINWQIFSWPKFILIFFTISLFTGSFFIFLSSITKNRRSLRKIGIRIILPLWFFGGGQFPWKIFYTSISKKFAYILLLNPWLYAMEGIHAAALGQEGFLPFWLCFIVLLAASILFGTIGIMRLKKYLDFI